MSKVTVAKMNLNPSAIADGAPDNGGWIMKRRKNDRNDNTNKKATNNSEKKPAANVVDLTENSNNLNTSRDESAKKEPSKIKFSQILQDRIDGKFSDEDLRLLLLKTLGNTGRPLFHITLDQLKTSMPKNYATEASVIRTANEPVEVEQETNNNNNNEDHESFSGSSEDDYASDHSNNGDYGLLDSSPFALTQSYLQDNQQSSFEIMSSQVKKEPVVSDIQNARRHIEEDLIELIESSDEEKVQSPPSAQVILKRESVSSNFSNNNTNNNNEDEWVVRKKPKIISDYFSLSRSSSISLDASTEVKKTDQSFEAVLASTTSSLKSSSSFSSKFPSIPLDDDDDFKIPTTKSPSPKKQRSQSYGESGKPKIIQRKKSNEKSPKEKNVKKFKKQEKTPTRRRLDPDDNGADLDDFK